MTALSCHDHHTLLIRADADSRIGTGHVMRCLALAQCWKDLGGMVFFISDCVSPFLRKLIESEGIHFITVNYPYPNRRDIEDTARILKQVKADYPAATPWIVIDGLHFDSSYRKKIKGLGARVLWIDDYGSTQQSCADIIVNQNMPANPSLYNSCDVHTKLLLGLSFVLLRREFRTRIEWQRKICPIGNRVLITMGGADPEDMSSKLTLLLRKAKVPGLEVAIVVGPENPHQENLRRNLKHLPVPHRILTCEVDMSAIMSWADIAIIASGGTLWELLFMGCAIISFVYNPVQEVIIRRLNHEGLLFYQGYVSEMDEATFLPCLEQIAHSEKKRAEIYNLSRRMIDGIGCERVIHTMCAGTDR